MKDTNTTKEEPTLTPEGKWNPKYKQKGERCDEMVSEISGNLRKMRPCLNVKPCSVHTEPLSACCRGQKAFFGINEICRQCMRPFVPQSTEESTFKNTIESNPVLSPEYIQNSSLPEGVKEFMIKALPWRKEILESKEASTGEWETEIHEMANGPYGNAINHWSYLDWITHFKKVVSRLRSESRKEGYEEGHTDGMELRKDYTEFNEDRANANEVRTEERNRIKKEINTLVNKEVDPIARYALENLKLKIDSPDEK